jgi:hypothetical protein
VLPPGVGLPVVVPAEPVAPGPLPPEEPPESTKQIPSLHVKPSKQSLAFEHFLKHRLSSNLLTVRQVSPAPHAAPLQLDVQMPLRPCGLSLSVTQMEPAHSPPEPVAPEHSPLVGFPLPCVPVTVLEQAVRPTDTASKMATPHTPRFLALARMGIHCSGGAGAHHSPVWTTPRGPDPGVVRSEVRMRHAPLPAPCATALAVLLACAAARADDATLTEARAAYDRGARAYDAGDFAMAAAELARADQLAPNVTVLELAIKSALRSDDALLGIALAERAEARGTAGGARDSAPALRARFEPRLGRVVVRCRAICTATIDGTPAAVGAPRWVLPGAHRVEIAVGAGQEWRDVSVAAGGLFQVEQAPPAPVPLPPAPPPADPSDGRISPAVFWIGLGATALLGVAAGFSAADTRDRHDQFVESPSEQAAQDGRGAQLRTNVLIGATIATGVLTGALGLFAVRWSR